MSKLMDSAVAITLFTALLFALSTANYNGYLSELGVEAGFIMRSSHQILYNALFVILAPFLKFLLWLFLGVGVLRMLAMIYTMIAREYYKIRKFLVWVRKKIRPVYVESKSEILMNKIIERFHIAPAFLLSILVLGFLIYAENEGKREAKKTLEELRAGRYEPHKVVKMKGYKSNIYIVSCGTNNCAGITIDNMEVVYFENKFLPNTVDNVIKIPKENT